MLIMLAPPCKESSRLKLRPGGPNSSKIQALEARCNHSHKHQSIAGVTEQGVYANTLTAEYPSSLALQLAQLGIGSKTGSFRQALPLRSEMPRTIALAPCRLPTCDGAGMHLCEDWCHPKPEHPLQQWPGPGCIGCMSANWCRKSWRTSLYTALSRRPKAWKWHMWLTRLCNCPALQI